MAAANLVYSNQAERALTRARGQEFERLTRALEAIKADPFIGKPLTGAFRGNWSYRVGKNRIIYAVDASTILIKLILPQDKAYR